MFQIGRIVVARVPKEKRITVGSGDVLRRNREELQGSGIDRVSVGGSSCGSDHLRKTAGTASEVRSALEV